MGVNVNFKRGNQASLNTLIAGSGNRYVEGTFYLTTDTDKLYFAQSATELVHLNQHIYIFTGSSLPSTATTGYSTLEEGDIYYWKNQNILAICQDPAQGVWIQINPDTQLVTNGSNITLSDDTNSVTFSLDVEDSKSHHSEGEFTIAGGTNVTVSRNGSTITIASTDTNDNATYTLATEQNTVSNTGIITLNGTGTGATATNVVVKGSGAVTISSTAGNEITIHGSGGVTGISNAIDTNGNFSTTLQVTGQSQSELDSNSIQPIIRYGQNSNVTAAFASGTANLSVYTKAEVDSLIADSEAAANAMTYAGTVIGTEVSSKLTTTANVGTTYKAAGGFTFNNEQVKTGDLLIAKGTDGNVTWDLVPSGDDQTISGDATGNTLTISDQATDLGSITVNGTANSYGTIAVDAATASNAALTLTVSHGAAGSGTAFDNSSITTQTTQVKKVALDIPIITGISKDAAGHVTSVSGATYRLTDTHANIKTVSASVSSTTTASAALTIEVEDTDNISQSDTIRVTSTNLEITSTTASNLNIDLVWGSF